MSTTIDQKVVEMRFDNKQFESGVSTTMSSLNKLQNSLDLKGASKGLDNIKSSLSNVNVGPLSNAVENVRYKFSALEVMAVTALANITNSAVNTGKRMISAFTIDPIKTGLAEYETQINAVQTILANTSSKGVNLQQVNDALDELNHYADKTIYNFTEMTRNIGTFTAAGVELDTSVSAIKGIANLAAVSGSTSQQASTAMYQLSQALAAGTVKLMDWNSVVNAGMGGQVFQDALKDTARVHGIAIDQMIEDEGSFRETLQNGWLSSEILTETLSKFTGDLTREQIKSMGYTEEQAEAIIKLGQTANDAATKVKTFSQLMDTLKEAAQSGWTQTWEILIGDFEEAKRLWTSVSDYFGEAINKSAEARNNLLQAWADKGGRQMALESITNAFEGLLSILRPIRDAFREVFPPLTVDQLLKFTEGVRDLTAKFKLSESQSNNLKATFKGLFTVLKVVVTVFKDIAVGAVNLVSHFGGIVDIILSISGAIGSFLTWVGDAITRTDLFGKAVSGITEFVGNALDKLNELTDAISGDVSTPGFDKFKEILEGIWEFIHKVGTKIVEFGKTVGDAFSGIFTKDNISSGITIFDSGVIAAILLGINKLIHSFGDADGMFTTFFDKFDEKLKGVTGILDSVKGSLESWQQNIKAGTLMKIAAAIALLAASIVTISLIDKDKLSASLGAITVLFVQLMTAMKVFDAMGLKLNNPLKSITVMIGMATSILILAGALKSIGELDMTQIGKGLLGVAGLMVIIVAATKAISTGDVAKGALQMVIFAGAIKVLASACKDLGSLDWKVLAKGLGSIGILFAEIAVFTNTAKFDNKKLLSTATSIVIIASAMKILASACADFGAISAKGLVKGIGSIGALLAEITLFTRLSGGANHILSTATSLVIIGGAMKVFASAVSDFASMEWGDIARGLTAMAGALTAVTIAVNLMPKNMISIGVGLIAVSAALTILADALVKMGNMTWGEVATGLVTLGGALVVLAFGLHAMNGALGGAAALAVAAVGLNLLAPALLMLGTMSVGSIAKSLVVLAGALGVLTVASYALTPVIGTLMLLSLALSGLVLALSVFMAALAATDITGAIAAVFSPLQALGDDASIGFLTDLLLLIPRVVVEVIKSIGEGIVAFCQVIIDGATIIGEAIKTVILTLVDVMITCAPALAKGALSLILEVLSALAEYSPQIVDKLFTFLIGVINATSIRMPELIQAGVNLFASFFDGVVSALEGVDYTTLAKAIAGIGLLSAMMLALSAVAALVPQAMVGVLAMGALIAEMALVIGAIGVLAQMPGLNWLINEGAGLLQNVGNAIGGFVGSIVGGFMGGVSSSFPKIAQDLSAFMTNLAPFINGASSIDASAMTGVKSLAQTILILTAADILNGIASFVTGGSSIADFGKQLEPFGKSMKAFSASIAGMDTNLVSNAASAGKALAEMAKTIPNTGGLISFFTGNNDMTTFGPQLESFGKSMKKYAESISGMDTEAVTNSATAGKALAELAKTVPNTGGLISFFTGENDLATFGSTLSKFGESMKSYSDSVVGINVDAITGSVTAARSLVKLSETFNNSGTSAMDGSNLKSFGSQIASFGKKLAEYATNTAGINPAQITSTVNATKSLVSLVKSMSGINADGAKAFSTSLKTLGKTSVDSFVKEFTNAKSKVASAINNMFVSITTVVNVKKASLSTAFTGVMTASINAINASQPKFKSAGQNVIKSFVDVVLNTAKTNVSKFSAASKALMDAFADGFKNGGNKAKTSLQSTLQSCVSALSSYKSKFASAGKNLADGFANGITSNTFKAEAASRSMANKSYQAAMKALDAHSPSKLFEKVGSYVPLGFANGIVKFTDVAVKAASSMASSTLKTVGSAVSEFGGLITHDMGSQQKMFVDTLDGNLLTAERYWEKLLMIENQGRLELAEIIESENKKTETLMNSANVFGEVAKKEKELTSSDIVKNLKDQVTQMEDYNKVMESLMNRLHGTNLEPVIKEMGVSSLDALKALNSMTDVELSKYVELYDKKYSLAQQTAANLQDTELSMYEFQQDMLDKTADILDEYKQEYQRTVDSLMDSSNIFKDVTEEDAISSEQLINNLERQIDQMTEYADTMAALQTRLAGTSLADVISEMGVSSLPELQALNAMTDKQLSNYVDLYDEKYELCKTAATTQLGSLEKETTAALSEMYSGINVNLQKFVDNFDGTIEGLEKCITTSKTISSGIAAEFSNGITEGTPKVVKAATTMGTETTGSLKQKVDEKAPVVGKSLVQGFASGITMNTFMAEASAAAMANAAYTAAMAALDAHSPSKLFTKVGSYVPAGFAIGIDKFSGVVKKAAGSMANVAIDTTKQAISRVGDVVNGGLDVAPTIRPVVDMSNLTSSASDMQLGSNIDISMSGTVDSLSRLMTNAQAEINASNNRVIEAIDNLRDDINTIYASDDSEIALYVDSKKLATSIAKPMNHQLNILSKREAF